MGRDIIATTAVTFIRVLRIDFGVRLVRMDSFHKPALFMTWRENDVDQNAGCNSGCSWCFVQHQGMAIYYSMQLEDYDN